LNRDASLPGSCSHGSRAGLELRITIDPHPKQSIYKKE
jgi:hypothetical protein